MATKNVSVAQIARKAVTADSKTRARLITGQDSAVTIDSFNNFAQNYGVGADNPLSTASYGFNPITRNRTLLEFIHRGSWLGGVAVDVVANDMTRGGVEMQGKINPKGMMSIEETSRTLNVWQSVNELLRWDRLYGGCIAVHLVEGQRLDTPLRLETIGKGQYKGLTILDRWMVQPTLNMLVTEYGPDLGLPKFYDVIGDAPSLRGQRIHHTRVIRREGVKLPYWQRLTENLWGTSILERLYDRMIAFDSATTGAAQLVYKAYIRTYKVKGLRDLIGAGGKVASLVYSYVDFMRKFQGTEGITLMDADDEFEGHSTTAFSGLDSALTHFAQQLAGALQIPLVRLFGMSPSGFSTGDTDLQMYYDTILQQQNDTMLVPVTRIYRAIAASEGVKLPDGFTLEFRSLWQLDEKEKSDIVTSVTGAIVQANEAGLISDQVAMKELRQASHNTGIFSNITDSDINGADDVAAPPEADEALTGGEEEAEGLPGAKKPAAKAKEDKPEPKSKDKDDKVEKDKKTKKVKDSIKAVALMKFFHDLDVVIENTAGSLRHGPNWTAQMAADYGYFLGTVGHDGDNVDVHVGPEHASRNVWIVDMRNLETGGFDEHKVLLGYNELKDALADFVLGYVTGDVWHRIVSINSLTMDQFKNWLANYRKPEGMT